MYSTTQLYRSVAVLALVTGILLLIPLLVMQFTGEVEWTGSDFLVAGILLFGTGLTYILAIRRAKGTTYKFAIGLGLASTLLLVWANLAVGLIGSENEPSNSIYLGVLVVGLIGAVLARFQPRGMAYTLFAMAATVVLIAVIALAYGMQHYNGSSVMEIINVNGFFAVLFTAAGLLFNRAARQRKKLKE